MHLFFKVFAYIKFLIVSKNHHGIHSPFVFDLLTKCLYRESTSPNFIQFKEYRQELISSNEKLEVTDLGSGSKIFTSNSREISKIISYVGISKKRARLLFNLTEYFQFNNTLEIGTSLGLSACAIALGNPNGFVTTLEGCKSTANLAKKMFKKYQLKNILVKLGDFEKTLPICLSNHSYDLIYFDGNHSKKATITYFEKSLTSVHENTVLIFDDIHWSRDMEEAWKYIKKNEHVSLTIDTFQWGFIFFRKGREKEHFTIRV